MSSVAVWRCGGVAAALGCTRLHAAARGCTRLHAAARGRAARAHRYRYDIEAVVRNAIVRPECAAGGAHCVDDWHAQSEDASERAE
eukprot:1650696-Prymnesium_polylepis.2